MRKGFRRSGWWISGLVLAAGALAAQKLGFHPGVWKDVLTEGGPTLAKYARPDWSDAARLLARLGETVAIGLWGTLLTILLSLPLTILAARNTTPHPAAYRVSREILNFMRAMPDALLTLIFIQGFGLGPWPGVLALGLHSAGYMGKVIAEAMERIPQGTLEGLASCGAGRLQIVRFGAWPSVEREVLSTSLYMVDRNVRVAATLGIVGAGGIGVDLSSSLRTFNYEQAGAILIGIVAMVLTVDTASNAIRKRIS